VNVPDYAFRRHRSPCNDRRLPTFSDPRTSHLLRGTYHAGPVMRALNLIALVALAGTGCATVRVDGVRRAEDSGIIEPVAFLIFQAKTPPNHSLVLQSALADEMQRRGIAAHFTIVPGPEKRKPGLVADALQEVPGFITIAPSDGTPYLNAVIDPVYYDLRAYRILKHPGPAVPGSGPDETTPINDGTGQTSIIWRGRAYARGGFSAENLGQVASQIVVKLVADRVLRDSQASAARAP
jgi:hypothetical protein